jgi:hypothetical protein
MLQRAKLWQNAIRLVVTGSGICPGLPAGRLG